MPNKCVYTALLDNYEQINPQPYAAQSEIPFICLTDNPNFQCAGWQARLIQPLFPSDPVRSQRELKLRPHIHLPEFSHSLYIDNAVILKQSPSSLFDLAEDAIDGLLLAPHSFRETVLDEFIEVARLGLDDNGRIFEQLNHYILGHSEVLSERPWWGGIIVRDHSNERLRAALDVWMQHVMRYSRRDQLSANMVFRLRSLRPKELRIDNFKSEFHTWPHAYGRGRNAGDGSVFVSMMPAVARLRMAQRAIADAAIERKNLEDEIKLLKGSALSSDKEGNGFGDFAQLSARYEQLAEIHRKLLADYNCLSAKQDELALLHEAMTRSVSWRLTAPLRALRQQFPAFSLPLSGKGKAKN